MEKKMSRQMSQDKRLGWMTLGTFVPVFVVSWVAGIAAGLAARQVGLLLHLSEPVGHTLSFVGITAARLVVWVPAARLVLKRRRRNLAFGLHRGWWIDLLGGVGITALAIGLVFIVGERLGWLTVEGWIWHAMPLDGWLGKVWVSLVINTLVALGEELIFRAYLLTGLQAAWGCSKALVIMLLVFGLVHLPAYSEQGMQSLALIYALGLAAMIGAALGLIYLRTGSLWMPIGIHLAWNLVENDVLNLPADLGNPNLIGALTRLQGPFALAGNYGNALVLDTLAFIILCAAVWLWFRRPTDNLQQTCTAMGA
jgi:membrane protease YdiL (CAAX protease family)